MRLPSEQPKRALVAVLVYAAVGGAGATGLVLLQGPVLGGLLAFMLLEALAVPLAVVGFSRQTGDSA